MGSIQKKILIVVDIDDGNSIVPITFELLGAARQIAENIGATVCAAVVGDFSPEPANEIAAYADRVYSVTDAALSSDLVEFHSESLAQLCQEIQPAVILVGHTLAGLDLALRLNCRLGGQMITDCVAFRPDPTGRHLACVKPVYGDNALATFTITRTPWMATLRPMAIDPAEKMPLAGELIAFQPDLTQVTPSYEIIDARRGENTGLDMAEAIVAGGRGVGNAEGFCLFESLIEVLAKHFTSVEMGASRPVIDAGWLPPFRQIGLTGEKVKPELYVGIGISGALQHMSGVFGAKTIIAINSDPDAQIFQYSDLGVVGDYRRVLPALVSGIREVA